MEVMAKISVPPLLTVPTLARLITQPGEDEKAKQRSIRRMCKDRTIPSQRIGTQWYIPRDVVLDGIIGGEAPDAA